MQLKPTEIAELAKTYFAKNPSVSVIGDLILDEWIVGSSTRISPEAPVLVLDVRPTGFTTTIGGAGNVAMNMEKMGGAIRIAGEVGEDGDGQALLELLEDSEIHCKAVISNYFKETVKKTRVVSHGQQIVRIDQGNTEHIDLGMVLLWLGDYRLLDNVDAVCLSDYNKGIFSGPVVASKLIKEAHEKGLKVTAGVKPANIEQFAGVDLLCLNEKEFDEALALADVNSDSDLVRRLQVKSLVVTRGALGARLFDEFGRSFEITPHDVGVADVTGAGDTFLAAATMALAGGATSHEAALIGNLAAAAAVSRHGVATIGIPEIMELARELES